MVEVVADEAKRHDLTLVLSVTHESTEVAVEWAREYQVAGADCLMVFPPSFLDPSADALMDHLRAVADAVSIPLMVQYRQPENPPMSPERLAELGREVDNIEYFKIETADTGPFISRLHEQAPDDVHTLVGMAGEAMIDAFDRGSVGVIPAASLFEVYVEIYEQYRAGNRERAIDLHDELVPVLNQISEAAIPFEKEILAKRGIIESGYCRKPLTSLPDRNRRELLDEQFERIGPLLEECSSGSDAQGEV